MKVYHCYFEGFSMHELHLCLSYLILLSRTVYSLTREMYLAGCELHIQTLLIMMRIFNRSVYVNNRRFVFLENRSCRSVLYWCKEARLNRLHQLLRCIDHVQYGSESLLNKSLVIRILDKVSASSLMNSLHNIFN